MQCSRCRQATGQISTIGFPRTPALQARLTEILEIMLADNRQAWDLAPDGVWTQRRPAPGENDRGTHQRLMDIARSQKAHHPA